MSKHLIQLLLLPFGYLRRMVRLDHIIEAEVAINEITAFVSFRQNLMVKAKAQWSRFLESD